MKAVFRHELSSYFTSVTAYVFAAVMLLFAGIYTMAINLSSGSASFEYVPGNMAFVFLIVVPILTMRCIAEEKKQKTDQLLYSLPLTMTKVALGKYLAMLVVFLVPVAVLCCYPLLLRSFGNVYLPTSYTAIFGFFLLGAALIAIGMFISSVTESQAIAAGLCFVVMLLNYYLSELAGYLSTTAFGSFAAFTVVILLLGLIIRLMTKSSFAALLVMVVLEVPLAILYILQSSKLEDIFPTVVENLSLYERFYQFMYGVFDLNSVVYFLTVIGIFLFLTVQSLEKRRWSE